MSIAKDCKQRLLTKDIKTEPKKVKSFNPIVKNHPLTESEKNYLKNNSDEKLIVIIDSIGKCGLETEYEIFTSQASKNNTRFESIAFEAIAEYSGLSKEVLNRLYGASNKCTNEGDGRVLALRYEKYTEVKDARDVYYLNVSDTIFFTILNVIKEINE